VGFLAAAGALLVGMPAALVAAGVTDWRWLTLVAVVAPVAALLSGVWRERFEKAVRARDDRARALAKGSYAPGGKLPRVREVDPITLGVHPAPMGEPGAGQDRVPVYIERDTDHGLRARLGESGFVLLVGDSTAGKTRAAFEAVRAALPDHLLIVPQDREGVEAAANTAGATRRCVLWLDDLESYLGAGGLSRKQVAEVLAGNGHHRVIVATLRTAEEDRLTAPGEDTVRQVQHDTQGVLDLAHRVFLERQFTAAEQDRAGEVAGMDPRIADALAHASTCGIAEYLACGPRLLREWENAWSRGAHPRGAALIAAAVDLRRSGYLAGASKILLEEVHADYLEARGGARLRPEPMEQAWRWATQVRQSGNPLLQPVEADRFEVFDYLLDVTQRRSPAGDHVPSDVITTALRFADADQATDLATTAYGEGRYQLAATAYRQALTSNLGQRGPDHPSTLTSRSDLALVLWALGRPAEAETENRTVLEARSRLLGADHPDTLISRRNLALALWELGRLTEAETENRAALETQTRVLGASHPDTLSSRHNLANVLRDLGEWTQAEAENRTVLEARTRLLGADHADTLTSRHNLANVLRDLSQWTAAEAEHRAVLDTRTRLLGANHPHTLHSRNSHAKVLRELGRWAEAETEHRTEVEAHIHLFGPDHPDTLSSRSDLAIVLQDLGRLAEAEAEHRAVLDARTTLFGAEAPDTMISRSNLALVLRNLGRLADAEIENRTVLEAQTRVLGAGHPHTLVSRRNLSIVLRGLGRPEEANQLE
jgi:tetratricopeptide (TPR) repeat protein